MPYVHLKIHEDRLTPEAEAELVTALTDAVVSVYGEDIRRGTLVILEPVPPARWAVGGRALRPL